jgi:hypothetical protein
MTKLFWWLEREYLDNYEEIGKLDLLYNNTVKNGCGRLSGEN